MTNGILEVELVGAKGLRNREFLGGGIDPYVLIQYKSQEHKSSVARGEGSNPIWNEKFTYRAEYPGRGGEYKLNIVLMDKDTFSSDDYIGKATHVLGDYYGLSHILYLKELLALGVEKGVSELRNSKYRIIAADQRYCGEIQVGVKFTPNVQAEENEEYGGWKDSEFY